MKNNNNNKMNHLEMNFKVNKNIFQIIHLRKMFQQINQYKKLIKIKKYIKIIQIWIINQIYKDYYKKENI